MVDSAASQQNTGTTSPLPTNSVNLPGDIGGVGEILAAGDQINETVLIGVDNDNAGSEEALCGVMLPPYQLIAGAG